MRLRPAVGILFLSFAILGCGRLGPKFRGDPYETGPWAGADTDRIDTIDLESISQTEPLTVQDAVEKNRAEAVERSAPEVQVELTLADVREGALANNLDLKVQQIGPSIARETYNEERAKFESLFTSNLDYSVVDRPFGLQAESLFSDVGAFKPMPSGGLMGVEYSTQRLDTNDPLSPASEFYENDLKFSISQPLLRGAGFHTNTHSIRVARLETGISEAQAKLETIRILAAADRAYWAVYGASREMGVRLQQYSLADRQLREARLAVEAKSAPEVEITRAESGVSTRLEAIINAATQLRLRERDLRRILNRADLPLESTVALVPRTQPNPVGLTFDRNSLAEFAVENRMEMLELELQLAIDRSQIDFDRNAALPLFTLDYEYNLNGLGRSFGDANDQIGGDDFADWSIGLQTEVPIGNQARKAQLRHAIQTRAQNLATREMRELAIRQEVYDALDLLDRNWQRILAARQEVLFAARTYEAERRLFQLGAEGRTSTDVLDAAARLALAQLREIAALVDYQIARVDIAFATGTLLGLADVRW